MKKLTNILSVIIVILVLGIASTNAQEYSVHGKVTDADTGEPLIGADVMLKAVNDATWEQRNDESWSFHNFGAATDVDGNFMLHNVPTGDWTLVCSYIGYHSYEFELQIPEDAGCDDREIYLCLSEEADRMRCEGVRPEITLLFTCRSTIRVRHPLMKTDQMNQRSVIKKKQIDNLPIGHDF